ncbi:MAG: hypothetical protein ACFFDI_30000 [Promethearchaeota archaeon]
MAISFEEKVAKAFDEGWLTEAQKEALLTKYRNQRGKEEKKSPLSVPHRNSLRAMRNALAHGQMSLLDFAKNIIQLELFKEFLLEVDKPKGLICYKCKKGVMMEGTASSWTEKEGFQLVIDILPARICGNKNCQEVIFSEETVVVEEQIINFLMAEVSKIQKMKPETLDKTKCPMCQSDTLEARHTRIIERHLQTLYHLQMQNIPLRAFCVQCGYKELGTKVSQAVDELTRNLGKMILKLMGTKALLSE